MWVHRVARVVFGGMLLHVGLLARDVGSCCIVCCEALRLKLDSGRRCVSVVT